MIKSAMVESAHCRSATAAHNYDGRGADHPIADQGSAPAGRIPGVRRRLCLAARPGSPDAGLGRVVLRLCALVAAVLVVRPRTLTLDQDGFSISGGLIRTARTTPWKDVTGFFPLRIRAGSSMVGFNYSADAASKPRGTWVATHLSGADAGISGGWSCSTADLANQLNAYRDRALAQR